MNDEKGNEEAIIYSTVGWFLENYSPVNSLDKKTCNQVTFKVDTKGLDAEGRTLLPPAVLWAFFNISSIIVFPGLGY